MGSYGGIIYIVIMLGVFYLIMFVPENKRKKKYGTMLSNLKVNDEIITRGGILGKIINIQEDYVVVQSGPDKMRFKLSKSGILNIITEKEDIKKETIVELDDSSK